MKAIRRPTPFTTKSDAWSNERDMSFLADSWIRYGAMSPNNGYFGQWRPHTISRSYLDMGFNTDRMMSRIFGTNHYRIHIM